MNFDKLIAKLNNVARSKFRQHEKVKKRLLSVRQLNYLYEICCKNNLIHKYVKKLIFYKIYNKKQKLYIIYNKLQVYYT